MLVKFDIGNDVFQKIKHLIEEKKYQDLNEFLNIAINNQVTEEFANLPWVGKKVTKSDSSQKEIADLLVEKSASSLEPIGLNWRNILQTKKPPPSDIEPQYDDLVWSFYNRFLPVKIVIHKLAMFTAVKIDWVELVDLQAHSYDLATKISERLREYEEQYDLARNQRLSTGLPTPESEKDRVKKIREKRKIEEKIESSRKRFMEQFVGKKIRSGGIDQFKGACFDMGLLAVRFSGDTVQLSMTQTGKEFALLENPVIEQGKNDVAFSENEVNFIFEKIIPKFRLEHRIINKIFKELKGNKLSSDEVNDIFKEEKMKFLKEKGESISKIEEDTEKDIIVRERVATMSRLSELGLVKWEIDKGGYSSYTLKMIKT